MHTIEGADAWLPFLLQGCDPLFPTGAYAHSGGLEEIAHFGVVKDEYSLGEFLKIQVLPSLANLDLPYLRYGYEAVLRKDIAALCGLDRDLDAVKICRELREASVQIGVRRLLALANIFPHPFAAAFDAARRKGEARGHHIAVFALQMALGGVPMDAALFAFLYQTLAGMCGASLKLIRIGQDGCQRALRQALTGAETAVRSSLLIERETAGWFNPLLEIASMRHEHAGERMFIS